MIMQTYVNANEEPAVRKAIDTLVEAQLGALEAVTANKSAPRLTPRQCEVVKLIAEGGSNKSVARDLRIAPRTVEFHMERVREKFCLRHRYDVVRFAIMEGIITIEVSPRGLRRIAETSAFRALEAALEARRAAVRAAVRAARS